MLDLQVQYKASQRENGYRWRKAFESVVGKGSIPTAGQNAFDAMRVKWDRLGPWHAVRTWQKAIVLSYLELSCAKRRLKEHHQWFDKDQFVMMLVVANFQSDTVAWD